MRILKKTAVVLAAAVIAAAVMTIFPAVLTLARAASVTQVRSTEETMKIVSTAFGEGQPIPKRFTCEGDDLSPALSWSDVPAAAKSLALIVDDPDAPDPAAPKMTWVHWVLYDIPVSSNGLSEAVAASALAPPTREGTNDWQRKGYGGPCPPIGRHRYFFKLYALDTQLGDKGALTRKQLETAMEGHVLGQTQLMGTYQKGDK